MTDGRTKVHTDQFEYGDPADSISGSLIAWNTPEAFDWHAADREAVEEILAAALSSRKVRIADVGAGTGRLLSTLSEFASELVAVEPDAERAAIAAVAAPDAEIFIGQVNEYRGLTIFDLVLLAHVVQHLTGEAAAQLLVDTRRRIDPSGHVLIVAPISLDNRMHWYRSYTDKVGRPIAEEVTEEGFLEELPNTRSLPVCHYSLAELNRLVESHDLQLERKIIIRTFRFLGVKTGRIEISELAASDVALLFVTQ